MEGRTVMESIHKRIGHIVVPYKHYVLVWSGFVNEVVIRDVRSTYCPADIVWIYNSHNGMWKPAQTTGNIPEKTSGSSAAVLDDYLYIFGGMVEFGEEAMQRHRNYLHRLHLPSMTWEKLFPRGPSPPSSDKGVGWAFGGKIYFFGGYGPRPDPSSLDFVFHADINNTNGRMGWNNNFFAYDPIENKWSRPNTRGRTPDPRAAHSASLMHSRAFIFGGRLGDTRTNDMYYLNMDTFTWSQNLNDPSKGPEGRSWLSLNFVSPKKAVVYGGLRQYGIAALDYWECEFSDDYESLEWTRCVSPIEPRVWHQAAFCKPTGELVIIGGVSTSPYEMEEEEHRIYKAKILEFDSESHIGSPLDAMEAAGFNVSETTYNENLSIFGIEESLSAIQDQTCTSLDLDATVAPEDSTRAVVTCHTSESPVYDFGLNQTYVITDFSSHFTTSSPQSVDLIGYNTGVESDSYDGLNNAVICTTSDDCDIMPSCGENNALLFGSPECSNSQSDDSEPHLMHTIEDGSYTSSKASYHHSTLDYSSGNENDCHPSPPTESPIISTPITHLSECSLLIDHYNKSNFEKTLTETNNVHSGDEKLYKINTNASKKRFRRCGRAINFDISFTSETQLDSDTISTENTYGSSSSDARGSGISSAARAKGTVSMSTAQVDTAAARTHRVPEIQVSTDHPVYTLVVSPANQTLPSETSNLQPDIASGTTCSRPQKRSLFRCSSPVNIIKKPSFKSYITPENSNSRNIMPKYPYSEGMVSDSGIESSKSRLPTSNTLETPRSHKPSSKPWRNAIEENCPSGLKSFFAPLLEETKPSTTPDAKKLITAAANLIVTASPLVKTVCVGAGMLTSPGQFWAGLSTFLWSAGLAAKATHSAFHEINSALSSPNTPDPNKQ